MARTLSTATESRFEGVEASCEISISARNEVERKESRKVLDQSVRLAKRRSRWTRTQWRFIVETPEKGTERGIR